MRRRIWLAISLAFLLLAGWMAFLHFEPRLFPIRDDEPLNAARGPGSEIYISPSGKTLEGDWSAEGDFDGAGMARVRKDGAYGWIHRDGKFALPAQWEEALDFDAHGLAPVRRDGHWGWIDRTGKFALPPRWKLATRFDSRGRALVWDGGAVKTIDRSGAEIARSRRGEEDYDLKHDAIDFLKRVADGGPTPNVGGVPLLLSNSFEFTEPISKEFRDGVVLEIYFNHPLINGPLGNWRPLRRLLEGWKPLSELILVHSPSGGVIWRSDLHYFRFLLLPAAGVSLALAAVAAWRYRMLRPKTV
jgi:hypothetical protein